ncbi:hypothetical protein BX666DRAFT_1941010 [Dichotomocladium elegans]|nr:hypothetical protein BX666DRAFT_1941010 [Dichotomocladium elegans]
MFRALTAAFLSFVFFYQLAQAASVTITSPKPGAVLKMGQAVEIKWKIADGYSYDKLSIALASGAAQALVIDQVIVANTDAKNGSYLWTIPENLKAKSKYVIEVGPSSSDIAFAGYISIVKPVTRASSAISAHASSSAHVSSSIHPSVSIPGNRKPSAVPSQPAPSAHKSKKAKPTPTASATSKPGKPTRTRRICNAFPDSNNQMTTSCREVPIPTETAKPAQHGILRRRDRFAKIKRRA